MEAKNHASQQVSNEPQPGQLLNQEQRAACEQIAAGETIDNRRAQALLFVDDGLIQAEAAQQAGLTLYQVKYCLVRFRKLGMAMFADVPPAATQPDPTPASELDASKSEPIAEPEPVVEVSEPVPEPEPVVEGVMTAESAGKKSGDKPAKGKKPKKKNKKSKKKARKSKSKSAKKKGAKKSNKKRKKNKKSNKDKGRKKNRKSKSGKSSGKKAKKKDNG